MNERYEYLLEQYFNRRITQEEQAALQTLIQENPSLAADFEFHQKTAAAIRRNEKAALKNILQNEEKRYGATPSSSPWKVWIKYAAAAAAVITLLIIYLPTSRNSDTPFVPWQNEFAAAGTTDTSTLQAASNAYQAGQYEQAAQLFGQLDQSVPAYAFYKGVAQCGARQYQAGIQTLLPIAEGAASEYQAPALYFIAWSYHQSESHEQAKIYAKKYLDTPKKRGDDVFRKNAGEF